MKSILAETLEKYRIMGRLPTREEAAKAAAVLLICNGHDLDTWMDHGDMDEDGLRSLASTTKTMV